MMLRTTSFALVLCSLLPAQADELMAIQRAGDRQGRDQLYALLQQTRVDVHFEDASAKDLAKFLATATGERINFAVWTKEELEPITLRLKRTPLTTVMDIAQRFSNIRFVYRKGIVLLQHPDEVVEYTSLRQYDVRSATTPIPSRPGPELKLTAPGDEESVPADDEDEGPTASGFTPDKLVDLIRTNVDPDSWDREGIEVNEFRGVLWVRQTDKGHREVEKLLQALGVISKPRVLVRPVRKTDAKAMSTSAPVIRTS